MKKFLVVLVALVAAAAMVTPVFAEDRLSIGGEMRVRAWHTDYDRADGSTDTWADQRLRMGGKFSIADGVSVTFRTDVTENSWGNGNGSGSGRSVEDGNFTMQWDRAHLDLVQGNFHLRAGQFYVAFGNATVDHQSNGLLVDLKAGPGKFTAFTTLADANGGNHDAFVSGLQYGMKNFTVFLGNQNSWLDAAEDVYVLGGTLNLDLGAVALSGELDVFTGDAAANTDATGTQMMVAVDLAPSDVLTLGGQVYYADSNDQADEVRYSYLGSGFGGWDPLFDVGTSLSNEQIGVGRAYDVFGDAGTVAVRVHTSIKASDAVKLGASVAYTMPEDDDLTTLDSSTMLAGALVYNVMDNTSLQFQAEYFINDDEADVVEDWLQVGTGLFVKF